MGKEYFNSMKDGVCDSVVDQLYNLWVECGEPEPEGGTTTETHMPAELLHDIDLGDGSTEDDVAAYESIITGLYNLVNIRYIGSGIWYTDYYTNDEFEKYASAGKEIVDEYINNNLWDDFSNHHVWDMDCIYQCKPIQKTDTLENWEKIYDKLSEDYEENIGWYEDEIIEETFDDWKEEHLQKIE